MGGESRTSTRGRGRLAPGPSVRGLSGALVADAAAAGRTRPRPGTLVVMGASAGGVEALRRVVGGLPAGLDATVCVVLHVAPGAPSSLSSILDRAGPLPCRAVADHERLGAAEILVAPPDRHVVVQDGHVALSSGPRENGHRPSIDTLFRSAAEALGPRVIGVVLSGTRDDGTAGLALVKALGGHTVVQDPDEALHGAMPRSAIAHVAVDAVLPSHEIANTIVAMVDGQWGDPRRDEDPAPGELEGEPVIGTCPECGGVLSEDRRAGLTQWRCKVGHRYSPESLADAQAEDVEAAIWAAVRALEDRQLLLERMAEQAGTRGSNASARIFGDRAREAQAQAAVLRRALEESLGGTLRSVVENTHDGREQVEG
jgi:two-component system chemotaxis response regulator CheB